MFLFITSLIEPPNPYNELQNRRKFFEDFAKEHNFDPLVPINWNNQFEKIKLSTVISFHYFTIICKMF